MISIKKLLDKVQHNKFLFAIVMIILFILVDFITVGFSGAFENFGGIVHFIMDISETTDAGKSILGEVIWGLCLLVVLLLSGNKYIFSQKKIPFKERMKVMWPTIAASVCLLVMGFHSAGGFDNINIYEIAAMAVLYFFVGIYEEFLCRGWLLNEFMERFGDTRKGVLYSLFISSLIFGFMHVTNIVVGQTVAQTIPQIIMAFVVGICFGAIYLKTKNIWSVVFLHGFYDFSVSISSMNTTSTCFSPTGLDEYTGILLLFFIVFATFINLFNNSPGLFTALKLLNKKNSNELITGTPVSLTEEEINKSKKGEKVLMVFNIIVLSLLAFFTLVSLLMPYEPDTCEKYTSLKINNYELTTINFDSYNIDYSYTNSYKVPCTNPELKCADISYTLSKNISFDIVDNTLVISDGANDETIDFKGIYTFGAFDTGKSYEIMLVDYVETGTLVYYESIPYEKINSEDILTYIKDNLTLLEMPITIKVGYLTMDGNKYPLFGTYYNTYYVVDENHLVRKLVR